MSILTHDTTTRPLPRAVVDAIIREHRNHMTVSPEVEFTVGEYRNTRALDLPAMTLGYSPARWALHGRARDSRLQ